MNTKIIGGELLDKDIYDSLKNFLNQQKGVIKFSYEDKAFEKEEVGSFSQEESEFIDNTLGSFLLKFHNILAEIKRLNSSIDSYQEELSDLVSNIDKKSNEHDIPFSFDKEKVLKYFQIQEEKFLINTKIDEQKNFNLNLFKNYFQENIDRPLTSSKENELFEWLEEIIKTDEKTIIVFTRLVYPHNFFFKVTKGKNDKNVIQISLQSLQSINETTSYILAFIIFSSVLSLILFNELDGHTQENHLHISTKDCVLTKCNSLEDILVMMKTADLCDKCLKHLGESKISELLLHQILTALGKIRDKISNINSIVNYVSKPTITIHDSSLSFYVNNEVHIENFYPLDKSLYLLFLKERNGLQRHQLKDKTRKTIFKKIYGILSKNPETEEIEKTIDKITDLKENSYFEVIARIKQKFKTLIPFSYENYIIRNSIKQNGVKVLLVNPEDVYFHFFYDHSNDTRLKKIIRSLYLNPGFLRKSLQINEIALIGKIALSAIENNIELFHKPQDGVKVNNFLNMDSFDVANIEKYPIEQIISKGDKLTTPYKVMTGKSKGPYETTIKFHFETIFILIDCFSFESGSSATLFQNINSNQDPLSSIWEGVDNMWGAKLKLLKDIKDLKQCNKDLLQLSIRFLTINEK